MTERARMPVVRSLTLSPDLAQVKGARRFVAEVATEAGFPEPRIFDITLVTSEAAANAVEHAPVKGHVLIRTLVYRDRLEIQVEGPGEFQTPARLKERHNRGLGLPLMAKLSDHLALYSGPHGGTLVSLIFYRPGMEKVSSTGLPPSIRELIDENELVSAITQNAPVGLFVVDPEMRYRWTNETYRAFLDEPYRSQDLTGVGFADAVPGAEESGLVDMLRGVSGTGKPVYVAEYEFAGFSRGVTYWRWEGMPLGIRSTPPFDVLVVLSEITEETSRRRQVEVLADEASLAADAYRMESERLQAVLQHMPSGVIIAEAPSGRLVAGNPQVAHIWRHPFFAAGNVTDYGAYKGFHLDGRPYLAEEWPLARSIRKGETVIGEEIRILRGDGTWGHILVSSSPIVNRGEIDAAVVVFDEVTEHREVEKAYEDNRARLSVVQDAIDLGIHDYDLSTGLVHCDDKTLEIWGLDVGEALDLEGFLAAVHVDDRALVREVLEGALDPQGGGVYRAEYRVVNLRDGITRWVSTTGRTHFEDDRPVWLIGTVWDVTESKTTECRLQIDKALFRGVADIFEEALSDRGERNLGQVCLEVAQEVTDSSVGFIGEVDAEGTLRNVAISAPGWEKRHRVRSGKGSNGGGEFSAHGLLKLMLEEGTNIVANEPSALPVNGGLPREHPELENFLGVPLRRKDEVVGIMAVANRAGGYEVEQEEMLSALGPIVVEAFDRKRAEESLRRSEERLAFALETSATGAWDLDLVELTFSRSAGYDRIFGHRSMVSTWTLEMFLEHVLPEDRELVAAKFRAAESKGMDCTLECRVRRADGAVRWVWMAGRHRLDTDGRPHLVGIIQDITERREAEEALRQSEERHRLLAEENARLYRQQLDIAENLQDALLNIPSEIGRVTLGHLYRSATEAARVGGDFYDAFPVKGGHIAVLIGDVSGHGIEAARTATLVKDVVHAFTHQSLRAHEVLRRTNNLLVEKDLPGFVTLFLGILDADSGVFRYCSAGHPEALLRRVSGEIQVLGSGSSPLGVYPNATWKSGQVELEAGDLLLLYTDGVLEARRDGEFFGEKRLQKILRQKRTRADNLPQKVLDSVLSFSGGTLTDDIAALALSLNEEEGRRPGKRSKQETLLQ